MKVKELIKILTDHCSPECEIKVLQGEFDIEDDAAIYHHRGTIDIYILAKNAEDVYGKILKDFEKLK